ncbi:MAG: hypothetical protein QXD56_06760 [Saccharolobus sp.]
MFKIWYIHIIISIIVLILSTLIVLEFVKVKREFKGKLTTVLIIFGSILIAQSISFLVDFILWSNERNPLYIYPSLLTVSLSFVSLIIFYYYITRI